MSTTKNNHYLSQCIARNFITNNTASFWQYNCETKGPLVERNIKKLFSKRKAWNQEFENILSRDLENNLAPIVKRLVSCTIERKRFVGKGFTEAEFNCIAISDTNECIQLSKIILQTGIFQMANIAEPEIDTNNGLAKHITGNGLKGLANPILVEINPLMNAPPLILIDDMPFLFFTPSQNRDSSGSVAFSFPISPSRFLIWSNDSELHYFCRKYHDINFLNLCRIEQNHKKCTIASQNKEYLENLIQTISSFDSGDSPRISTARKPG